MKTAMKTAFILSAALLSTTALAGTAQAQDVQIENAVARVIVLVEDRSDVAVEIERGRADLPLPTVRQRGDRIEMRHQLVALPFSAYGLRMMVRRFTAEVDAAFAMYALGWHYDAGIQFIRLVLAGTFDRLPGLQVILGHWGEVVLFYAERLPALDRVSGLEHPIATYLRRNLHVTASGMFLPGYLAQASAIVGADRLLFSTDFPYQYRPGGDARRFLAECGLAEAEKKGFAHGNWMRLTGTGHA